MPRMALMAVALMPTSRIFSHLDLSFLASSSVRMIRALPGTEGTRSGIELPLHLFGRDDVEAARGGVVVVFFSDEAPHEVAECGCVGPAVRLLVAEALPVPVRVLAAAQLDVFGPAGEHLGGVGNGEGDQ